MDLLEHAGKDLFARHGVPVPDRALYNGGDVELPPGDRLVVKAQVPAGKRKKHGGIEIVDRDDAVDAADAMLGRDVAGHTVDAVLIESFVTIAAERYLSLSIDRAGKAYTLLYSPDGGSGIEQRDEAMVRIHGYGRDDIAERMVDAGVPDAVQETALQLYGLMRDEDALLVEVNPLVETETGETMATDAKVRIDDNALFRHDWADDSELTGLEAEAAEQGLEFVSLDGSIGVIGNGAGLVMATLDSIDAFGGSPANFLDVGGGADVATMEAAMDVTTRQDIDGLFINIFGGITRCDQIAQGIIDFVDRRGLDVPLVVRLVGTNQDEGKQLLEDAGIHAHDSMDACAETIMELTGDA